jgi:hypothetical protein
MVYNQLQHWFLCMKDIISIYFQKNHMCIFIRKGNSLSSLVMYWPSPCAEYYSTHTTISYMVHRLLPPGEQQHNQTIQRFSFTTAWACLHQIQHCFLAITVPNGFTPIRLTQSNTLELNHPFTNSHNPVSLLFPIFYASSFFWRFCIGLIVMDQCLWLCAAQRLQVAIDNHPVINSLYKQLMTNRSNGDYADPWPDDPP